MHDIAKLVSTELKVRSGRGGWGLAIGGLLTLVILLVGIKGLQITKMMAAAKATTPPPQTVSSAEVREENWAPVLSAIGSVSAVQGAIIAAELGGVVSDIKFENGGVAKKGNVIMKLDASQEEALLRSAEAEAELARTDLERTQGLASQKVVSNGVCRLCVAAATSGKIIFRSGSARDYGCSAGSRIPWKANRGELDGRYRHTKCLCAGDAGESGSPVASRDVRKG